MILADSSVWIDYFNGRASAETDLLDRVLQVEPVLMGDLILTEVLQGFRRDQDFRRASAVLLDLPLALLGGREVALEAARNYRALRARGVTVRKTIDMVISTFCIINGHTLLHADRDFEPMEAYLGLRTLRG